MDNIHRSRTLVGQVHSCTLRCALLLSTTVSWPVPRGGAVLRVVFDFGFGAAGSQRRHDAVLECEGDHVTAPRHRKNLHRKHSYIHHTYFLLLRSSTFTSWHKSLPVDGNQTVSRKVINWSIRWWFLTDLRSGRLLSYPVVTSLMWTIGMPPHVFGYDASPSKFLMRLKIFWMVGGSLQTTYDVLDTWWPYLQTGSHNRSNCQNKSRINSCANENCFWGCDGLKVATRGLTSSLRGTRLSFWKSNQFWSETLQQVNVVWRRTETITHPSNRLQHFNNSTLKVLPFSPPSLQLNQTEFNQDSSNNT